MSEKSVTTSSLSILVIAELAGDQISTDTLSTLTAAGEIGGESGAEICVLLFGPHYETAVQQLSRVRGVNRILVAGSAEFEHPVAESMAEVVVKESMDGDELRFSHVLAAATTFGKNLMPRVAARLGVGQLSDVISVESPDTVIRPVYAGNALAKVKSCDPVKIMTIRSTAFEKAPEKRAEDESSVDLDVIDYSSDATISEFVSMKRSEAVRPELASARVVVSGGRGLADKERFSLVEQLADTLGGAVGASRAAVDAGFVSNDLQVGQTGKVVAPELYIAVGISGAIQHLAGMKDSGVIVAINSDPDAPIFKVADYGLVGDLFTIMPELIRQIEEK